MSIAYEPAAYVPAPPHQRKSRVPAVVITLLMVALIVVGLVAFGQHNQVTETKADLASTNADLKDANTNLKTTEGTLADTQETLTTTQDSLTSANGTIDGQNEQLSACSAVVDISGHQTAASLLLLKAMDDDTLSQLTAAIGYLEKATTHYDSINRILRNHGDGTYKTLYAACTAGNSSDL